MSRSRPIFHLDSERGLRGGERQLLYLAEALRARGRRCVVYARAGAELAAESRRRALETRTLPYLWEWDPLSAAKLAFDAAREGAVLHAHTGHAAGVAALAASAPRVVHRRVDFPVSGASARWKYGRASRVVAVSRAIADILASAGTPPDRVSVVPDAIPATPEECRWAGVDERLFARPSAEERESLRARLRQELGLPGTAVLVGNLAALVPHKDHDTLIAAALLARMRRPELHFLIAGQGPEEKRLFESLKRMNLLGKVLLVGQREPAPLLKALDLYVQSSWGEGMGSVLLEAMACGVPIAATRAGGIPELVEDGATGLLVPPRDPEALAAAILRLSDDAGLGKRLADEARARLPRFGLKSMAERMEAIYDSLD